MGYDDLTELLDDPELLDYLKAELPAACAARGVPAPAAVGADLAWILPYIPVILDLIKRWLESRDS